MKFKHNSHLSMKLILILFFVLNSLNIFISDPSPPRFNKYKDDKLVKHSLFREKDSIDRMSASPQGIPIKENVNSINPDDPNRPIIEPEKLIANKIVNEYKDMFTYLDFIVVNELLDAEELSIAFADFNWPKSVPEEDDIQHAKRIIEKYDQNKKNSINFIEFTKFMEDLWNVKDVLSQKRCVFALQKATKTMLDLFKWLDRDEDKYITPEDMIYGISRILIRDINLKEVKEVFALYDLEKKGKIDFNTFLLAMANNKLHDSFHDIYNTETMF